MKPLNAAVEPALQACSALPAWKKKDAETDLAEDDGINGDFPLVLTQPVDDACIGPRFGGLAQNIRID